MNTHLDIILKEMCNRVDAKYDLIDFRDQDWYQQYTWTTKEELEFVDWMVEYLYTHKEARQEIMKFPTKRKSHIKEAVWWFIFNYGWKVKDEL